MKTVVIQTDNKKVDIEGFNGDVLVNNEPVGVVQNLEVIKDEHDLYAVKGWFVLNKGANVNGRLVAIVEDGKLTGITVVDD